MASSVFYKFGSQKNESRITFDGTGISVFDLKREIILANNMGKANDFDLSIYDGTSKQEFKDDSEIIPRSSSVVVKRLPAARPGKGKASMYVNGVGSAPLGQDSANKIGVPLVQTWNKGAMSRRFDVKDETASSKIVSSTTAASLLNTSITNDDEKAAVAAMFQAQTANWEETQEKMSHAQRIYTSSRGTGFSRGGAKPHHHHPPEKPLPPSYVCYRCGQKGHWIQDCPTNNDRDFDNRPRIKRTTGIPRSMLKVVTNPGGSELTQGVMVTPEGSYVVAQPDLASWQKQASRTTALTAAEVRAKAPTDRSLACPVDNKLFRDAVKTPCCGTLYCEECIQSHLLERDFTCPNCSKKVASLDKLTIDRPMREKVAEYIEKAIEDSKRECEEAPSFKAGTTTNTGQNTPEQDDLYSGQQAVDMAQIVDSIPQLQAQISQISLMLQNSSLPHQVRQATEMQHQQLQMQLQQAQTLSAALAAVQQVQNGGFSMQQQGYQQQTSWVNQFSNQQLAGQDSAYQRLPVNNRRRNLKRERPSDFLEINGESEIKTPRYWE